MEEEIKNLQEQSKKDLEVAEKNFNIGEYYITAFLCQQAVEKALKALLMKKTKRLMKIHDLVILGRKVNMPVDLIKKAEKISRAYVETRYGDVTGMTPYKRFNKENTSEYLKIAKEIITWSKKSI